MYMIRISRVNLARRVTPDTRSLTDRRVPFSMLKQAKADKRSAGEIRIMKKKTRNSFNDSDDRK